MKSSEYRYNIERIYFESTNINSWLLSDDDFKLFVDLAMSCKAGNLVLENWKIFLCGQGEKSASEFFEWWNEYRPDKLEHEPEESKKKSPFDEVRRVFK